MRKMVLVILVLLLATTPVHAVWISVTGNVVKLITYATDETILVQLDTNGADVPECVNKTQFAVSRTVSSEARARMYALLLAAKTSDSTVTITFNDSGGCESWDSTTNAYRKIIRLQ